MANYFIIGGDQKQYGPVTDGDVRQWIAEGRLGAQSLAKGEGDAEFRALEQFPEFAEAFAPGVAAGNVSPASDPADFTERDYELDLGGCISSGWNLVKGNLAVLILSFLVLVAVEIAFSGVLNLAMIPLAGSLLHAPIAVRLGENYLLSAVLALVMGPMMGGVYLVYLKTIRNEVTGVGEVFAGFQKAYGQLFLGSLVVSLIIGACMLPFNFVWQMKAGPLLEQLQQLKNSAPADINKLMPQLLSAFLSALPILFICLIPVTYLTVSWQFTLPLIIDKQMTFGTAMKTSWKMVNKHWWQVFGLTILVGLVSAAGVLACCVGALFTIPVGLAAAMIAYETIFSGEKI